LKRTQGQSTLEYAVVIAVVVSALLAMQIYMKRGAQGKLRQATDDIGEQFSPTAYRGKFQMVQKSITEETLHVANQLKGESKSQTTGTGITSNRTGMDIGNGANERLTNAQSVEGCLFSPCP
jgi:hypothetical protein